MSVLVSKCEGSYEKFSKKLFIEVSNNLEIMSDEEWEANKNEFKSVLIAVYMRTDKDNLVLMTDTDKFATVSQAPPFMMNGGMYHNFLIDSGLMCGKSILESAFNVKNNEAFYRMVKNSTCYPVGAVETDKNYIAVFNVIISSELLTDTDIVLNQGNHFKPIETLNVSDTLQKAISESLVVVRK